MQLNITPGRDLFFPARRFYIFGSLLPLVKNNLPLQRPKISLAPSRKNHFGANKHCLRFPACRSQGHRPYDPHRQKLPPDSSLTGDKIVYAMKGAGLPLRQIFSVSSAPNPLFLCPVRRLACAGLHLHFTGTGKVDKGTGGWIFRNPGG